MKTKISKSEGYYKLLVGDEKVNNFYKSEKPILLGCISNYAATGFWTVLDFRLSSYCFPSAYLLDGVEVLKAKDTEELEFIKNNLQHYKISEDDPMELYWNRYYCTSFDGADRYPTEEDQKRFLYVPRQACFSFKKAQEKLSEMKKYWEEQNIDYSKGITAEHLIHNPELQKSASDFITERVLKELHGSKSLKL